MWESGVVAPEYGLRVPVAVCVEGRGAGGGMREA